VACYAVAVDLGARRIAYAQRLEAALERIVRALAQVEGIQRVSLVGSAARGRRDLFTDLDLLVVWRTDLSPVDRLRCLYPLLHSAVDVDLLCYTPEEFEALRETPFLRRIASEAVVLHETKPA
jgi:predicted nucleotidyltransferase